MTESEKAVETLKKMIVAAAQKAASEASFDRTSFGVVKEKNGNSYVVNAFGRDYTIKSSQNFSLYERVAVTAPQSNFSNLIIRKV